MHLINYLEFLGPFQETFTKFYSVATTIVTAVFILWLFNFIAGLIQKTYSTGKAFGNFYWKYLHTVFKRLISPITSTLKTRTDTIANQRVKPIT